MLIEIILIISDKDLFDFFVMIFVFVAPKLFNNVNDEYLIHK